MQVKNGLVNGMLRVIGKIKAGTVEADAFVGNLNGCTITGAAGDFVIIGSNGKVATKTVPTAEGSSF